MGRIPPDRRQLGWSPGHPTVQRDVLMDQAGRLVPRVNDDLAAGQRQDRRLGQRAVV